MPVTILVGIAACCAALLTIAIVLLPQDVQLVPGFKELRSRRLMCPANLHALSKPVRVDELRGM